MTTVLYLPCSRRVTVSFIGKEPCAAGQSPSRGSLLRHHFIDPNARYVGVALRHLFSVVEARGADDREAGDGIGCQRQLLRAGFGDFPAAAEVASHVDDMAFRRLEPFAPGGHYFRGGFFKSVVQQNKLLHDDLLLVRGSMFVSGWFAVARLRSARSNSRGS